MRSFDECIKRLDEIDHLQKTTGDLSKTLIREYSDTLHEAYDVLDESLKKLSEY